jgi:hypothetical protein
MNLFEIEIGRRYKYHHRDGQYFATVKEKQDGTTAPSALCSGRKLERLLMVAIRWTN